MDSSLASLPPRRSKQHPITERHESGSMSMELPSRFQIEEDDTVEDDTSSDTAYMQQSVLGVIAAAQSQDDFQSILQQTGSDDESAQEEEEQVRTPASSRAKGDEQESVAQRSARSRHSKRLSGDKLARSLPGLPLRERREMPGQDQTGRSALSRHDLSSPSRDAPFMSQMLQARANAEELEASNVTIGARPSRDASTSSRRSKAPKTLPHALMEIFQLQTPEEVIAEYPCWYLQNILLQGYMYITQNHICFYAYLQKKSNNTVKSGYLSKCGKTNPHYRKYWFSLKGNVLSYFTDPSSLYFPTGSIDLRYGISAEITAAKEPNKESASFTIVTDKRTYYFKADSATSAQEWVKQIQNIIFRSHNNGDSVKICLPVDNVLDVEENSLTNFAETIRIRVADNDETFAVDEYFFSFFSAGKDALNVLKVMTQDTAAARAAAGGDNELSTAPSITVPDSMQPSASVIVQGASDHDQSPIQGSKSGLPADADEASIASSADQSRIFDPTTEAASDHGLSASRILNGSAVFHDSTLKASNPTKGKSKLSGISLAMRDQMESSIASPSTTSPIEAESDTVPGIVKPKSREQRPSLAGTTTGPASQADGRRSSTYSESIKGLVRAGSYPIQGAKDIAGLLRTQSKNVGTLLGTSPKGYYDKISGAWAGGQKHYSGLDALHGDESMHSHDEENDAAVAEQRFRNHFALPDTEKLVASFFGHLLRVLPLYGKVYVGSTKLCFRSLLPGTRTKLIIPFKDILNVEKEKGFRFGYSGTVVVIRGHEEIFFEFNTAGLRDDCTITILRSLESTKRTSESVVVTQQEKLDADVAARENMLLQAARQDGHADHDLKSPRNVNISESNAPAILFDDPEASVVDFAPEKSLRIVCLTIGSRGDVQPYIALCKGLLKEGHRPKIATHAEFEPWIRKHGIDFAPVEGDPAELMRICIENGMFTPSFLLEANSKFRVFLEQLLATAWSACQDADLLIESPSAMAGIHVAEALSIPYFRAFTMSWTRTRAYPHAFAVPNNKMGGAYNYMTYIFFDNLFWTSTAGQVNRWRKEVLGLRPTSLEKLQQNKVPFLYNFSPSVVIPPLDFSDWIRVTGYWFLDEATDWRPQEPLQAFITKARQDKVPLVYIGFGSIVVSDSKAMTQAIISAVLKADVRCILSKGWSDRLSKAGVTDVPLPDSIYQIQSAPHDWLFKQIDAAVHHGGAGTTGASLRAGVPTIIKPFFGDQYFNGNRIHDLGVGLHINHISENVLGKALWIATHDERMKEKARLLGEQIRSEDGVGTAIKCIYRDLDYARSLIKKQDHRPVSGKEDEEPAQDAAANEHDLGVEDEESWTFVENDSDVDVLQASWSDMDKYLSQGKRASMALGNLSLKRRF